jgi:hypothetical protein
MRSSMHILNMSLDIPQSSVSLNPWYTLALPLPALRRQPRLMEVAERPSGPGGGGGSSGPGGAAAAAGAGGDAATALCFGQHGGGSLLMLSGHASGALKVWELKSHLTGGGGASSFHKGCWRYWCCRKST